MIDLEELILNADSLDAINPELEDLPKKDGMLIWHAMAFAEEWLKNYIQDAPESEKENLIQGTKLIKLSQTSTRQALNSYPELFQSVENWLKQEDLTDVNVSKALTLTKSIDYVLKALPHDCKKISWPLSNWIPATLYTEVARLQTLCQYKFNQLIQANKQEQVELLGEDNPYHLLRIILNDGLQNLRNKTSAIAENKEAHLFLLTHFNNLKQHIDSDSSKHLNSFWDAYSETDDFEQLMEILLLEQDEKKSWRRSFEYFKRNHATTPGFLGNMNGVLSSIYNMTNYGLLGASLTPELLNKKLNQAVEILYKQIIDRRLQTEDQTKWLEQLNTAVKNSEAHPLLLQLFDLYERISLPPPSQKITLLDFDGQYQSLTHKVEYTFQERIKDVVALRNEIDNLFKAISQMRTQISIKKEETKQYLACLDDIGRLSTVSDFKLTDIKSSDMARCIEDIKNLLLEDFTHQIPSGYEIETQTDLLNFYDACNQQLNERAIACRRLLRSFNEKGEQLRQDGLQEFKIFLASKQGFWETIFRLFSSHYRTCMANIESILHNYDSSLDKVNSISNLLDSTANCTSYFVRKRVEQYKNCSRHRLFQHYVKAEEQTYELDISLESPQEIDPLTI